MSSLDVVCSVYGNTMLKAVMNEFSLNTQTSYLDVVCSVYGDTTLKAVMNEVVPEHANVLPPCHPFRVW